MKNDYEIYEGLPAIRFIGDLNLDQVPDVIIRHNTHRAESETYLYMSGYSKDKILVKVGESYWGGCY